MERKKRVSAIWTKMVMGVHALSRDYWSRLSENYGERLESILSAPSEDQKCTSMKKLASILLNDAISSFVKANPDRISE